MKEKDLKSLNRDSERLPVRSSSQATTVFIFFCEKENEPKEIAPCYVTRQRVLAGAPVLLASVGVCETHPPEERRRAQTVTASIPTDPVMLGT